MRTLPRHRGEYSDAPLRIHWPKHRRCTDGKKGGPCITCEVGLSNGHAACTLAVSA